MESRWQSHPERLTELKRIATIESIGSPTRIEGVKLTDADVSRIMTSLSTQSFNTRDEQDVAGYPLVLNEIYESWEEMPLTENVIKQMHSMLMRFSDKDARHRGQYKTVDNKGMKTLFLREKSLQSQVRVETHSDQSDKVRKNMAPKSRLKKIRMCTCTK